MTNNQWDDDKLEKLLHSMPKFEDNRSKEQILVNLKKDQRLKNTRRMNPKKWLPIIVAVAALVLLSLLVPSMLNNQDRTMEDSEPSIFNERAIDSSENETMESADTFDTSSGKESAAITFSTVESNVVLADELYDTTTFHIGLVEAANVIPVTFLIPDSIIKSDFSKGNPTSIDLYNKYAEQILEEELGFDEYHPYKGTLYGEDGIIYHQIPTDHSYDLSGASVGTYYNSMRETFTEFGTLRLEDDNGNPASFESVGKSEEDLKKRYPYFKYVMPSGKTYLIPYEAAVSTETVAEALAAMKEANGNIVEVLIPENVDYDVRVEDDIAVITFKEQLDVTTYEQNELNQMIEGFMLTAKGYGKQVQLENVLQETFSKYDLTDALPMPIGSNPLFFTQ